MGKKKEMPADDASKGKPGKKRTPPPVIDPPAKAPAPPKPRDCGRCRGGGTVETAVAAKDEEGTYTDYVESPCPTCGGSGTI